MEFKIEVDKDKLVRAMAIAPRFLEAELADAADHIRRKYFQLFPTVTGIRGNRKWFFRMIKGYVNRQAGRLDKFSLRITTYWKGARLQEFGGVKEIGGRLMTIPVGEALTTYGRVKKSYRYASKVPRTYSVRINGKLLVFQRPSRNSRNQSPKLIYALVRSARINPKLKFAETWDKLSSFRDARLNIAIERALTKVARA